LAFSFNISRNQASAGIVKRKAKSASDAWYFFKEGKRGPDAVDSFQRSRRTERIRSGRTLSAASTINPCPVTAACEKSSVTVTKKRPLSLGSSGRGGDML